MGSTIRVNTVSVEIFKVINFLNSRCELHINFFILVYKPQWPTKSMKINTP